MQFSAWCLARHDGAYRTLKAPGRQVPPAQQDPAVVARVTEMLATIERDGLDAVLRYAKELDHFDGDQLELDRGRHRPQRRRARPGAARAPSSSAPSAPAPSPRPTARRSATSTSSWPPACAPATATYRSSRVGAYLPAGRFPLLASAFMTVGVAKAAGVGDGARLHAAAARRRGERGGAVHRPPHRRRPRLRPRRRPGARRHGLRAARRTARRHARRCRQRLRRRGEAPAVRRGWRSTCSPARRRSPSSPTTPPTPRSWPPTCSARPSTARTRPPRSSPPPRRSGAR